MTKQSHFMRGVGLMGLGLMAATALAAFTSTAVTARTLDTSVPEDALIVQQKIICGSTEAGRVRFGTWWGRAYGRVPWEKDRVLFNVVGTNVRQCAVVKDPERGTGFRSVSREVMFYLDPKTNKVLETWDNPYTGQKNTVIHVANDPVNMREPQFARAKDGTPVKVELEPVGKDLLVSRSEVPLYYDNPLLGPYQKEMGGTYQAMEIFTRFYPKDLLDSSKKNLSGSHLAWNRVSQWLPWMQMEGRPGTMIFVTAGNSVNGFDDLDPILKDQISRNFPKYKEPPPTSDTRPNETSWTYYKKIKDGSEKQSVK
ncbi:MAG: DUF1838 family protein [Rhodospirillaceae bacterium]|nr:DUF1838 family protein [Rhodospirillaceae bacterium]